MDKFWVSLLLISLIWLPSYACYRLGKYLERKDLTQALANVIEETFEDGRAQGKRDSRQYILDNCDTVPMEWGRR